jgi:hypothetical protein
MSEEFPRNDSIRMKHIFKHPVASFHVQCQYYRHNATQSYIYTLPSPSKHVSASVGHLQVLAPTPKLPHCIE